MGLLGRTDAAMQQPYVHGSGNGGIGKFCEIAVANTELSLHSTVSIVQIDHMPCEVWKALKHPQC